MLRARVGLIPTMSARARLFRLLQDGSTVAAYQAGNGLTGSTNASAWASYVGSEKYLALPGASGNSVTTPNAAANQITSDIDIRAKIAATDWTPSGTQTIVAKWNGAGQRSYILQLLSAGTLQLAISANGTVAVIAASSVATGVTDGTAKWVRATWSNSGDIVTFYLSDDGSSWTQLGTTVACAATGIFAATGNLVVGSNPEAAQDFVGNIYNVQIYNGIGGTLAVDFDASRFSITSTNGATAVASTGETWTLNNTGATPARIETSPTLLQATGANQPTINADGSLTFDGSSDFLKTAAFTLNQPETIYLVGKQITFSNNASVFDGNATDSGRLIQWSGASPQIRIGAGAGVPPANDGWTLDTRAVLTAVINGASSFIAVNGTAGSATNAGSNNMGGFMLGSDGAGSARWSNIQVWEAIVRNVADSAATQSRIQRYLAQIYGTP